jgi:hypothetical protein
MFSMLSIHYEMKNLIIRVDAMCRGAKHNHEQQKKLVEAKREIERFEEVIDEWKGIDTDISSQKAKLEEQGNIIDSLMKPKE